MVDFPSLEAHDIIIRRPRSEDERSWGALGSLDDVRPVGIGTVGEALEGWEMHGYGMFVIEDRVRGELAGVVGIARPYRCKGPHLVVAVVRQERGTPRDGQRESLALRACRGVIAWWHESRGPELFAHVDPSNIRGQRLATALGGERVSPIDGYFAGTMVDYAFRRGSM